MSIAKLPKSEIVRKLLHIPIISIPFLALYSKGITLIILTLLISGYLFILVIGKKLNRDILMASSIIGFCQRNVKYDLAPAYMAMGMLIAVLLSPPMFVFYAAYILIVCDSAAALVGIPFGKHKIFGLPKTVEGSLAFFATCFLGSLYFLSPIHSVFAAIVLTLFEIVSSQGLDNFTLPIISQLLLIYFLQ